MILEIDTRIDKITKRSIEKSLLKDQSKNSLRRLLIKRNPSNFERGGRASKGEKIHPPYSTNPPALNGSVQGMEEARPSAERQPLYVQELWNDLAGSREIILISGLVSCHVLQRTATREGEEGIRRRREIALLHLRSPGHVHVAWSIAWLRGIARNFFSPPPPRCTHVVFRSIGCILVSYAMISENQSTIYIHIASWKSREKLREETLLKFIRCSYLLDDSSRFETKRKEKKKEGEKKKERKRRECNHFTLCSNNDNEATVSLTEQHVTIQSVEAPPK